VAASEPIPPTDCSGVLVGGVEVRPVLIFLTVIYRMPACIQFLVQPGSPLVVRRRSGFPPGALPRRGGSRALATASWVDGHNLITREIARASRTP
jgi:hypothetical protein